MSLLTRVSMSTMIGYYIARTPKGIQGPFVKVHQENLELISTNVDFQGFTRIP